jgi:hypothetical protein
LPISDWDGRVFVGARVNTFGKKKMARHPVKKLQEIQVSDALSPNLFDETAPVPYVPQVVQSSRFHPRISSNNR